MTSSTGSVNLTVLSSSRFHAVDCAIKADRLEAGWVYIDGYLSAVETLKGDGIEVSIVIPPDIQAIQNPTTFSFADEPVEWMLSHAPKLT